MPARRRRPTEEISTAELRRMLMEKQRGDHKKRLEQFQKAGRILQIARDPQPSTLQSFQSEFIETAGEYSGARAVARPRNRWLDRFLLMVEIVAAVGLIFIMIYGFNTMRDLNTQVASALEQPTLTPTALIMAVVLPSGHTPPNAAGGAQPNEAEIPEHLRPIVQSLANVPIPTSSPEQATRIQIPSIKVDAPVVQGDGWDQLKKGVGQHIGTADPGKAGNTVFSAHNDVFGEIFRDLDKIKTGDQVILFTNTRQFVYTVTDTQIVEPTKVDVMNATSQPTITLISCYPYMVDKQRIVVTAVLQNKP
jgi:sortase A